MAKSDEDKPALEDVKDEHVNSVAQPSNDLAKSETAPDSNVGCTEKHANNDSPKSETHHNNDVANSETRHYNDQASSEAQNINDQGNAEIRDDDLANAETQKSDDLPNAETQRNDDLANVSTQNSDDLANTETRVNGDLTNVETQNNDDMATSETQRNDGLANAETWNQHDSEKSTSYIPNSEIKPNNNLSSSEIQPNSDHVTYEAHDMTHTELESSNDMEKSNEKLHSDLAKSEPQHNNEHPNSDAQVNIDLANSGTKDMNRVADNEKKLDSDFESHDTQPNNSISDSEMQTGNKIADIEMLSETELVSSGAPPENRLVNSEDNLLETDYQLSDSEPQANNQNQLVDTGMLVDDKLSKSEVLHCDQLANSGTQSENHQTNFESMPGNRLVNAEVLHGHQLSNSETMHQMANSEATHHHELVNADTLHNNQLVNSETFHNNELVNSQSLHNYELANNETINGYEIVNIEAPENNEDRTPETQPNKRRKKKSIVWEHFTIETVSDGCRRACCKQCKQSFAYSTGSKVAGTSHLKRHIAKGTCPALLRNQDPNQLTSYTPRSRATGTGSASNTPKRRYRSSSSPYVIFDQDRCRHEIARMIIMHDYPLHMVEHPGFVAFVQNLQPQFNMVTFNTVQGDCVATYLMEKQKLMRFIEGIPGRFCLTLDTWASNQSVGYVFITGHFIDVDWKLQRRILNVVMEPYPDSDSALSHAVSACISDWNLDGRVFSITTNKLPSVAALENLRPLLSVKNTHILNGQLLLGNCIACTLSSAAKEVSGSAGAIVKRIRDSVKYVKTLESHEEKFLELKKQLQVSTEKCLCLDNQTQWNTTYQMLEAASELKEVFLHLDTCDPDYKKSPSLEDWKLVETLCSYLKPLYDAANVLSTTTHPTAVAFFHEVWKFHLDLARAVMSEEPFTSGLTKIMHEKIDIYWRDCCLALSMAVVMDPRFKMKLIEFSFSKIYGEEASTYVKIVDDGIHELFHEYVALPLPLTPTYAEEGSTRGNVKMEESPGGTLLSDNGLTDFDVYIMETTSQQMKSELDQYLDESLLPRVPDFDVLSWWKLNKMKYPTLSKMARDILSIPVCSKTVDSVFDTKRKEMDPYRCSLRPETVEALVCAKDWMQYGATEASIASVKMEF